MAVSKGRRGGVVSKHTRSGKGKITSSKFNRTVQKGYHNYKSKKLRRDFKKSVRPMYGKALKKGALRRQFAKRALPRKASFNRYASQKNLRTRFHKATKPHIHRRMVERKVNHDMIKNTIKYGKKYYDPHLFNKSYCYILKNGAGKNRHLLVATDPFSGRMKTVMDNRNINKLVKKRFLPIKGKSIIKDHFNERR